jgi:hypothetical protein
MNQGTPSSTANKLQEYLDAVQQLEDALAPIPPDPLLLVSTVAQCVSHLDATTRREISFILQPRLIDMRKQGRPEYDLIPVAKFIWLVTHTYSSMYQMLLEDHITPEQAGEGFVRSMYSGMLPAFGPGLNSISMGIGLTFEARRHEWKATQSALNAQAEDHS